MNLYKLFQTKLYNLDKREVFLIGFYVSFLFVMTLAMVLDFLIQNYVDAYVEVFFIALTVISVIHYKYTLNITIAVYGIVIIATLTTYALLVSNSYNISIFHSIVPLGYFLLFSLKRSLVYTFIHQCIVVAIYMYGFYIYPQNEILHNPAILTATAMASLMIILFGVFYHLSIENSYSKLQAADKQKEMLLKEVHHRVKNNLNIISSMLGLQMLRETDEVIKDVFQKNRLRIDSIAIVHETLYKHNNFEKIDINTYLHQLSSFVLDMSDKEIGFEIDGEKLLLPFEDVLKIGIITNELLLNSIKYSCENDSAKIHITFKDEKDSYLYKYEDSATSHIDTTNLKSGKSLGLKLIDMMVQQMEASLSVDGSSGLKYEIRIQKHG
ncbi:sensor histidine kinase [Sulfurimonas sp.]|uniref:sensor histidine kinase n=1 Tax=Sulfurimonas sp. TaxID=2022749 RepID=UPI003D10D641